MTTDEQSAYWRSQYRRLMDEAYRLQIEAEVAQRRAEILDGEAQRDLDRVVAEIYGNA